MSWTVGWCRQSQNRANFEFGLKFELKDPGRSFHKTEYTLTNLFCTFSPNFVILACMGPEASCGQASDWHTGRHTHTHTETQATTIPEGQNLSRVKPHNIYVLLEWAFPCQFCIYLVPNFWTLNAQFGELSCGSVTKPWNFSMVQLLPYIESHNSFYSVSWNSILKT